MIYDDYRTLNKLRLVLQAISKVDAEMPLGYLRVLLELMLLQIDTGPTRYAVTQKELQDRTGNEQSSVSRAVSALCEQRQGLTKASAYGLAEQFVDPEDRRRRIVRLSSEGRLMLSHLIRILEEERDAFKDSPIYEGPKLRPTSLRKVRDDTG